MIFGNCRIFGRRKTLESITILVVVTCLTLLLCSLSAAQTDQIEKHHTVSFSITRMISSVEPIDIIRMHSGSHGSHQT